MNPIMERVFEAILRIDEALNLTFVSATGLTWIGKSLPALKSSFLAMVHTDDHKLLRDAVATRSETFSIYVRLKADGKDKWTCLRATRTPVISQYLICVLDISSFDTQDSELVHAAEHDSLTKLPNRARLNDFINDLVDANTGPFSVALLDLDGFKKVNDTMGHPAGDFVLIDTAKRLNKCVDLKTDLVARLGGDEFVIVLANAADTQRTDIALNKVLTSLARPFETKPYAAYIGCSIGIATFPDNGTGYSDLLKNADSAMYHSKRNGKNQITRYQEAKEINDLEIKAALHRGIEEGEFRMAYQPVYDWLGNIVGAEALMRWESSGLEGVSTEDFIRVAEETGLIQYLGEWALRYACMQLLVFQEVIPDFKVSVNVSPRQFQDKGFLDMVRNVILETGVSPKNVSLEITESCIMAETARGLDCLNALREEGISLSVDDFGTGFSSLTQLTRLPISSLKIDKSFVWMIDKADPKDLEYGLKLLKAIVGLGKSIDLVCIAEGVETVEQRDYLASIGCGLFQGYLMSKPVFSEELIELLKHNSKVESK
jgi:diguanylate cyclase (GGDEF)-like protein